MNSSENQTDISRDDHIITTKNSVLGLVVRSTLFLVLAFPSVKAFFFPKVWDLNVVICPYNE